MNLLRVKWDSKLSVPSVVNHQNSNKTDAREVCSASVFLFGKFFNMQSDNITNIKEIKIHSGKTFRIPSN